MGNAFETWNYRRGQGVGMIDTSRLADGSGDYVLAPSAGR
jgi:hypothetical protein